jgi:hypothetical protein
VAALKGLVIGLGILIVIGMTALAYGLYQKSQNPEFTFLSLSSEPPAEKNPAAPSPVLKEGALEAFSDITISLPSECIIEAMRPDGDRLYLQIGPSGQCARIIVIDTRQGRILGKVVIAP